MKNLFKFKDKLFFLCFCNKKQFKNLIQNESSNFINVLCECVMNVTNGNIKISNSLFRKLKKKKNILRELLKKSSFEKKKKVIQEGGFINLIIPSILSTLSSILTNLLANKSENEIH